MSLTDREVVERERICITNVECANHTKCKSGQGLGGSHLKSCNNDGALEIELAEIFIFICFAFCLHTDAAWRKQHVTFLCTSWTVLFVCVKTFKSSRGIRTLSKLYPHVIGTLIRCSPPHFSMPQLQNYITARELVQIGSGWLLCTFACRMRWLSLGQDKREDKNQEIIRLVCLCVCMWRLFTIQQQPTDPGIGVIGITDSEVHFGKLHRHNRYILMLTCVTYV